MRKSLPTLKRGFHISTGCIFFLVHCYYKIPLDLLQSASEEKPNPLWTVVYSKFFRDLSGQSFFYSSRSVEFFYATDIYSLFNRFLMMIAHFLLYVRIKPAMNVWTESIMQDKKLCLWCNKIVVNFLTDVVLGLMSEWSEKPLTNVFF